MLKKTRELRAARAQDRKNYAIVVRPLARNYSTDKAWNVVVVRIHDQQDVWNIKTDNVRKAKRRARKIIRFMEQEGRILP